MGGRVMDEIRVFAEEDQVCIPPTAAADAVPGGGRALPGETDSAQRTRDTCLGPGRPLIMTQVQFFVFRLGGCSGSVTASLLSDSVQVTALQLFCQGHCHGYPSHYYCCSSRYH